MTSPSENWRPTPELLAAYFDGECEGRDDLFPLKQRIEQWLLANRHGQEEMTAHRRLLQIWHEASVPEPQPEQWAAMFSRIESAVKAAAQETAKKARFARPRVRALVSTCLAASVAGLVIFLGWDVNRREHRPGAEHASVQPARTDRDVEVLPVTRYNDVKILCIDSGDANAIPGFALPVPGKIQLINHGDIVMSTAKKDDSNAVRLLDNIPHPMIWSPLDSETDN